MIQELKDAINEMILAKKLAGENKDEIYSSCKKLIQETGTGDEYNNCIKYICSQLNY